MLNRKTPFLLSSLLVSALTLTLSGCGGGSESSPSTGVASLSVTDAAVDDVDMVKLTFDRIVLQPANGNRIEYKLDPPTVIDNLLDLQGGNSAVILPPLALPAGKYSWVRLYVTEDFPDSYVETLIGGQEDLRLPGQGKNDKHLQLSSGFVVTAGGRTDFVVDIDLRKALVKPASDDFYKLRPSLRIEDMAQTGTVAGNISALLLNGADCGFDSLTGAGLAVYLYEGHDAITGDVQVDDQGQSVDDDGPLTTDTASLSTSTSDYVYQIGFVPAGDYTAALSCEASEDDASTDDDIDFLQTINLNVSAGNTTTVDFN